jgi:hypothetical protein
MTAKFIRKIDGWRSDARLYKLDTPVEYDSRFDDGTQFTDHVIVSGVYVAMSGPETYIFPATPEGSALNMHELVGSFQGAIDHARALRQAGYTLVE